MCVTANERCGSRKLDDESSCCALPPDEETNMLKPLLWCSPLLLLGAWGQQQPMPATAMPAEAAQMVNPIQATPVSQAHAKKLYGYDCALCHGATGKGNGELVRDLKLSMKDWSDPAALKNRTDGELFYIISNGEGPMPAEGSRAKQEDIWNLVVLVRSFSKP
jgi:mono/diheme cytochrome c family protein